LEIENTLAMHLISMPIPLIFQFTVSENLTEAFSFPDLIGPNEF
jgi:hypothetical protein